MERVYRIKEEFRINLPAITHVDGTGRLQTVTKSSNSLYFELIKLLGKKTGFPIILNTSFNIKGAPILTTIEDALYVLDNTEMDFVYIEGFIFKKSKNFFFMTIGKFIVTIYYNCI